MARGGKGITQFYLSPTHKPYLPLLPSRRASPPFGWYSLRLLTEGWPGWVHMGGWLYTEIDFLVLYLGRHFAIDAPFCLRFALKVTHPLPSKDADFDRLSLITSQLLRDSENSSFMTNRTLTTGFPTSYGWIAYVTPKSRKGWHKNRFLFLIKFSFHSIKSATKFLCLKTSSGGVVLQSFSHLTVHSNLKFSLKLTHLFKIAELVRSLSLIAELLII